MVESCGPESPFLTPIMVQKYQMSVITAQKRTLIYGCLINQFSGVSGPLLVDIWSF